MALGLSNINPDKEGHKNSSSQPDSHGTGQKLAIDFGNAVTFSVILGAQNQQALQESETSTQDSASQNLTLKPGEESLRTRLQNLLDAGKPFTAYELLKTEMLNDRAIQTDLLLDVAYDTLQRVQQEHKHETTLIRDLMSLMGDYYGKSMQPAAQNDTGFSSIPMERTSFKPQNKAPFRSGPEYSFAA